MSCYQNIAIAGASGNIGKVVVKELLASNFNVTALQRPTSTATFPDGVQVRTVIHDSIDSWRAALEGQDALISFLVPPVTDFQNLAADAAVAAKVRCFIPSEWGMDTTILGDTVFGKLLSDKTSTRVHLDKLAKENEFFSWTGISTGLWFDWGLEHLSLGFDKNAMTAEISDSGNERFQTTNLDFVAKVVAAILKNPAQASNKYITIASFNISQREILALAGQISWRKWTVKSCKVDDVQRAAEKDLANGNFDAAFYPLLHSRLFRDGADLALKPEQKFAQEVLGFSEEDPADAIKAWLKE
ncbi:NmrA domain-containing protein [Fusarium sp. LHS14.1]|nr:NmrA domain-containing protein [Fusarium sp. LHS14.1]